MSASRKVVTFLFSDVVGSTALGESLDPEVLRGVLSAYFDRMRGVLERHGGTVEKYIGDAIVAVFGVPELHEDDALRAVRAADEMRDELASLNAELELRHGVRVSVRTGINTGEVLVDEARTDLPLTADTANVAARLEQSAGIGEILLGGPTYRLVKDAVTVEAVDPLEAKGKAAPLEAWRLVDVAPDVPGVARRLDSPVVGRESELAQLRDAFERTVSERSCTLVTILGEPGLGKSRLSAELVSRLEGRARVLRGRCLPYGEGITFWPVAEVVRDAAGLSDEDLPEEATAKIARMLPDDEDGRATTGYLASLLGLSEAAPSQETFWGIRRFLETLAERDPVVVIWDDVHWGEPTFLDLVEYLSGFSTGAPLLLVCPARPELLDARPAWGSAAGTSMLIRLRPLTEDDSERLIDNLLGSAPLDEPVRARIRQAAEGNPLFVEEILRMLVDDGVLRRDDGRWVAGGGIGEIAIPPTINALLSARLERLPAEERAVIERAAVVGKVFWWRAVAEVSPEDARARVGANLQALVRKELVRPDRSAFAGEDAFRFSHILIRDAAYGGTTKRVRAEAHERFAGWLERRAGERVAEWEEIIGYHLHQAAAYGAELGLDPQRSRALADRAADMLARAGQRAFHRSDISAAISLLSRAVGLFDRSDPRRLALLPDLAQALGDAAQLDRSREVVAEALERAREIGDERLAALALMAQWTGFSQMLAPELRSEKARRDIEDAIVVFERHGDERGLAQAWRLMGVVRWREGSAAAAEDSIERSLAYARRVGEPREEGESYLILSAVLVQGPRPLDEASRRAEEILTEKWANRGTVASMCHALGHLRAWEGRFEDATAFARRYSDILRENGQEAVYADSMEVVADIEIARGNPEAAARALLHGHRHLASLGAAEMSQLDPFLAEALYAAGDLERAEAPARGAARSEHPLWRPLGRSVLAKILARRGDREAEPLAREAVAAYETTDFLNFQARTTANLAEVLRLLGRIGEATRLFERAASIYELKGATTLAAQARAALDASGR